ncbi:MAG: iron ABC transporter permease [Nocardioidaceae bacterium]
MRTSSRGWATIGLLALVPTGFLVVFFVTPVLGMLRLGLWPGGHLDLGGVGEVLTRSRTLRVLWFTLWSATVATLIAVAVGLPLAALLYRRAFPGRAALRAVVAVPFVLPTVVVGVAFRTLLAESGPLGALSLDGTAAAIIAALVFFNVSVVVRAVGASWAGLDPRPAEAAASLGASPLTVARTVTLPMLRPAIASAASVVFLFCATAFGVVLTLGGLRHATIETEIYLLTTQFLDLRAAAALSVLQLAMVAVLLVVTSRRQPGAIARRPFRAPLPRARDWPLLAICLAGLVFLVTPLIALVVRSLRRESSWTLANYTALNDPSEGSGLLVPVSAALANSLRIAVDATLLATLLGLLVSILVTRPARGHAQKTLRILDAAFMLPLGVSAVTVGFGFLVTLDRPPLDFRGSPWLVPIAQALVALPLVVRTLVPVLGTIDDRQREALASLGAGPWRVFLAVDLALLWRPVAVAVGFAFAVSLGEFGATSFLVRPETPTLPVVIYQLIGRPGADSFGLALAASVVLAAVTVAVMGVVERLRPPTMGGW